jgi:hypothetical protein
VLEALSGIARRRASLTEAPLRGSPDPSGQSAG